ncbi:hypothetical protein CDAR_477181 [Caerostris darwini]|uniref:Uncharacterized protein n=1 Tax=Caerostris darwini TaxID=1538125 RepID=A0AAV4TVK0_9ARAC|nr:hypothetical protein CDAR_477181 [Caerostris darwini]
MKIKELELWDCELHRLERHHRSSKEPQQYINWSQQLHPLYQYKRAANVNGFPISGGGLNGFYKDLHANQQERHRFKVTRRIYPSLYIIPYEHRSRSGVPDRFKWLAIRQHSSTYTRAIYYTPACLLRQTSYRKSAYESGPDNKGH